MILVIADAGLAPFDCLRLWNVLLAFFSNHIKWCCNKQHHSIIMIIRLFEKSKSITMLPVCYIAHILPPHPPPMPAMTMRSLLGVQCVRWICFLKWRVWLNMIKMWMSKGVGLFHWHTFYSEVLDKFICLSTVHFWPWVTLKGQSQDHTDFQALYLIKELS